MGYNQEFIVVITNDACYSGPIIQMKTIGAGTHAYAQDTLSLQYPSWEPHENVQECHRLLTSFWAHVGVDNDDYPIGYCVEAKTHWISMWTSTLQFLVMWLTICLDKEKAFFAVEFFQQQKTDKKAKDKQASKEPETSKNVPPCYQLARAPLTSLSQKKKSSRKKNDDSKFGASASSSKGKGKEKATVAQDTVCNRHPVGDNLLNTSVGYNRRFR